MFFSHFMIFPTLLEQNLGIQNNYFSFNVFFVFFLYAGNIEKCPFTYSYWLNGRWFLQIVDREFYHEIGNIEKFPFTYWLNGGGGFSKS